MKNLFFFFLFITGIVALYAYAFSFSEVRFADGKQIFLDNKCTSCHSVESFQIASSNKKAVDLSNASDGKTAEFLSKFLLKEEMLNNKNHKTKFKGTEDELSALVEWLLTLKKD